MNAWEELTERCACRRREKIGTLSDQGFEELKLAVRKDLNAFVDDPADQAFHLLAQALDAFREGIVDDEFLESDDAFESAHKKRLFALSSACDEALALDEGCLDARLVQAIAQSDGPDETLVALMRLERDYGLSNTPVSWDDVFCRAPLRVRAAVARVALDGARAKLALSAAESLMAVMPDDQLGARFTAALALARLEDEKGFNELDSRFGDKESAWSHLGRTLLFYKLNRLSAAKRSLRSYNTLCAGGAYALLRPFYVETYLPDRPEAKPCSFEECTLAVREAEPIISDTPDFIDWCQSFDWLTDSARRFSENNDFDW